MPLPFEHPPKVFDSVDRPQHYADSGIQCIEAIEASMSEEALMGFLKGNVMKYVWRYEKKNGLQDLKKAKWYLKELIAHLELKEEPEEDDNGCKDGFCPMPGVRYDLPPANQDMFHPVADT